MNILFLSGQYPPNTKGGAEISTHLIARGLVELGHEVTVATEGEKVSDDTFEGVQVLRRPLTLTAKPLFEKRHARRVAARLREEFGVFEDYDVVHAHDFRSALVLYELGLTDAVVTARDYAQISGDTNYVFADGSIPDAPMSFGAAMRSHRVAEAAFPRNMFRLFQYVWNMKYRARVFRSFSKQIFISGSQQEEIMRHQEFADQRQTVIYNPISPEYFDEAQTKVVDNSVLYAGRVEMYKGVGLLLAAWKSLGSAVSLRIVGRGAQKEEYQVLVHEWNLDKHVTFSKHIPYEHLKDEYDGASIVVAPHIWLEPFGRTIVEGMARGKIVVATDAGGASELVDNTKTGFTFERGSTESLSAALRSALTLSPEERQVVGNAAREWVRERLSLDKIARQHEDFYRAK